MEAFISSYGLVGKESNFAVYIVDDSGAVHKRVVPLKLKSTYQAELAAIKYVCQAIPNKDVELVIKTSVTQLPQVFQKAEDGRWAKRQQNKMVDDARELTEKFSKFSCVKDTDSELMLKVRNMAKLSRI